MLIKYRCGVVYSSRNRRCRNRTDTMTSKSTIHIRSSFTFKRSLSKWRPTIRVNRPQQMVYVADENNVITSTHSSPVFWHSFFDKLYVDLKKSYKTFPFQCGLFAFLLIIGTLGIPLLIGHHPAQYACYSSTNRRVAALRLAVANSCSDLTGLPCSLQTRIDAYLFWSRCFVLYYMSIIISIIYAWHRTVRCSYCICALSMARDVIFHTDIVPQFNALIHVIYILCFNTYLTFLSLEALMPYESSDPLLALCQTIASPMESDEILHGHSKRARFYQWAKKMKQEWGIEEEKLIFTLISGIVTNVLMIGWLFVVCR